MMVQCFCEIISIVESTRSFCLSSKSVDDERDETHISFHRWLVAHLTFVHLISDLMVEDMSMALDTV